MLSWKLSGYTKSERLRSTSCGDCGCNRAIMHTTLMITNERGIVPQVDLRVPLDPKVLNETGAKICRLYDHVLHAKVDTIAFKDRESFALYFP